MKSPEEIRRRLRCLEHENKIISKKLPGIPVAQRLIAITAMKSLQWVLCQLDPEEDADIEQGVKEHERMYGSGN